MYDVVLATGAFSESSYAKQMDGDTKDIQYASKDLNKAIKKAAEELSIPIHERMIHSSDCFYNDRAEEIAKLVKEKDCVAVEMESFALFHNAQNLKKKAACLITISDSLITHEETTPEERQSSFTNMMKIALEAAIK